MGTGPTADSDPRDGTKVTVVHTTACHFCEDAQQALRELSERYPLTIATVAADSPEGERLISANAVGMFPLVLVDGVFFSQGRLPRRKLRKLLDARATSPAGVAS